MGTIFKKIIDKEMPADIVFEDDFIVAFKDIHPIAPVHILIVPKKEIADLQSLKEEDFPLLGKIVAIAQKLAAQYGITKGYRLIVNNGPLAGQSILHLHFHLVGGRSLKWDQ